MAGSLAFREAMAKAGPVLLEPISLLEVTVPATMQGDVLGDLNSRRGRVQGTDSVDGGCRRSPPSSPPPRSSATPSTCARSPGAGAASVAEHDHYDVMPANLVERMAKAKANGS